MRTVFGRGFDSRRLHHFFVANKALSVSSAARLHNVSKRGDGNRLLKQPNRRVSRRRRQVHVPLGCPQIGMPCRGWTKVPGDGAHWYRCDGGLRIWRTSASVIHAKEPPKTLGHTAEDVEVLILSTNLADAGVGEWGFSALVRVDGTCILFDTGQYPETVLENAARLDVDLSCVRDVVLSHFHGDHIGGGGYSRNRHSGEESGHSHSSSCR